MAGMTWTRLAERLGVDERTLREWRKREGAPRRPNLSDWQAFTTSTGETSTDTADLPGECPYDRVVKKGQIDYGKARVREQVIGEGLANQRRRIEIEKEAGRLVDRKEVVKATEKIRDLIFEELRGLGRKVVGKSDLNPQQRRELTKLIDSETKDCLKAAVERARGSR